MLSSAADVSSAVPLYQMRKNTPVQCAAAAPAPGYYCGQVSAWHAPGGRASRCCCCSVGLAQDLVHQRRAPAECGHTTPLKW